MYLNWRLVVIRLKWWEIFRNP